MKPNKKNLIKKAPTISSSPKILVSLLLLIAVSEILFPNKLVPKNIE